MRRQNFKLSDVQFIYRYTVLELVRRGFRPALAKRMVKESPLLEKAKQASWVYFHDMDERDWADMIERYHNKLGHIRYEREKALA